MKFCFSLLLLLLVQTLPVAAPFAEAQGPSPIPTEISVAADAWAWLPPNIVRATIVVKATSGSAVEALTSLHSKSEKIINALHKGGIPELRITERGHEVSGGANPGMPIAKGTQVHVTGYIGAETTAVADIAALVDRALLAGALSVKDIVYIVRGNEETKVKAAAEAAHRGKIKAKAVASTLGVKLGSLISATVTEAPEGRILRMRRQEGRDLGNYSDQELHVSVVLRYQINE